MNDGEALLIGVQTYQSELFSTLSAAVDVKKVSDVLKSSPYGVSGKFLSADDTTTDSLEQNLISFLNPSGRSGEALIYFSGHGFQMIDRRDVSRKKLDGYLATSDCKVKLKNDSIPNSPVELNGPPGLSLQWLNDLIHQSNRHSVVLLIDACHSGHAAIQASLLKNSFDRGKLRNFHVIAACQEGGTAKSQERSSCADQKGGIFTRYLVDGLSEERGYRNSDGEITSSALFEFIYKKLTRPDDGSIIKQWPIQANYSDSPIVLKKYTPLASDNPLIIQPPSPIQDPKTQQTLHPYPGLEAFDENHAELFFGREYVIDTIQKKLEKSSFIPVIGASGSGKSSVVRAGLIPRLKKAANWKVLEPIKPDKHALKKLKRVLVRNCLKDYCDESTCDDLEFGDQITTQDFVNEISSIPASPELPNFLVFIDQFEEIFTLVTNKLSSDEGQDVDALNPIEQQTFIELLTQIPLVPNSPISVVITMRADFMGHFLRYESLHKQIQDDHAVFMPPMSEAEFQRAIEKPAIRQGGSIEVRLLKALLKEAKSDPGTLPLLQFALKQLWDNSNDKNELTWDDYQNLGQKKLSDSDDIDSPQSLCHPMNGLQRALNVYADKVYEFRDFNQRESLEHRSDVEQQWIRQIFVNLVRTGEGSRDTRERQLESHLFGIVKNASKNEKETFSTLLDQLVNSRLLVRGDADSTAIQALISKQPKASNKEHDAFKQSDQAIKTIDLAHEALISGWQLFALWLKDDRDVRRVADQMQGTRRRWKEVASKDKTEYLMMGALLSQVREYWSKGQIQSYLLDSEEDEDLKTDNQTFFHLSDNHEKAEKEKLKRALTEAEVQVKASQANNCFASGKVLEAMTLGIQAVGQNWEHLPDRMMGSVQGNLLKFVQPGFSSDFIGGHTDYVRSVAYSPDGNTLVSGSEDKSIRLWNVADGTLLRTLEGHTDYVRSVAYSPDGNTLVSGSDDESIWVWNEFGWRSWLKTSFRCLGNRWMHDWEGTAARTRLLEKGYSLAETGEFEQAVDTIHLALTCGNRSLMNEQITGASERDLEALAQMKITPYLIAQAETLARAKDALIPQERYENLLEILKQAKQFDPSLPFEPKAKSKQLMAWRLKQHSNVLILQDNLPEGLTTLKEAQDYDSTLNLISEDEARSIAAPALVDQGKWLASTIQRVKSIQDATARLTLAREKLIQAKQYDNALLFEPDQEVSHAATPALIRLGQDWAKVGQAADALEVYRFAEPEQILVKDWNQLCWWGTLHAAKQKNPKLIKNILTISESALKSEAEDTSYRDTLGIARVLAGGKNRWQSAIKDLTFYLEQQEDTSPSCELRQQIIVDLKAALADSTRKRYTNLLSAETIDQLINE